MQYDLIGRLLVSGPPSLLPPPFYVVAFTGESLLKAGAEGGWKGRKLQIPTGHGARDGERDGRSRPSNAVSPKVNHALGQNGTAAFTIHIAGSEEWGGLLAAWLGNE